MGIDAHDCGLLHDSEARGLPLQCGHTEDHLAEPRGRLEREPETDSRDVGWRIIPGADLVATQDHRVHLMTRIAQGDMQPLTEAAAPWAGAIQRAWAHPYLCPAV